ncbi:MAG: V-type ATP synthase subunit I [bacterium]
MAVAKLQKLFIAVHKSEEKQLLKSLRSINAAEIHSVRQDTEAEPGDVSNYENIISSLEQSIDILENYKGLLSELSKNGKIVVSSDEYNEIAGKTDPLELTETIMNIEKKFQDINAKSKSLDSEIHQLKVWNKFRGNLSSLGQHGHHTIKLGKLTANASQMEQLKNSIGDKGIDISLLHSASNICYILLAYHNDCSKDVNELLTDTAFEEADFPGMKGTISENIEQKKEEIVHLHNQKKTLMSEVKVIIAKYEKPLKVLLDYYENNYEVEKAIQGGYSTKTVSFYTCWIKKNRLKETDKIQERFLFTKIMPVEPDKDETIPVTLENKGFFQPFEIVTELYGVPKYHEIDPTPFLSLWFAVFFGLCLTDAGYGFILAVAGFILMKKMKASAKFMKLFAISGLFTILAGAVFNGWFGDLPSYLGAGDFFSKIAVLGDPIKTDEGSMNFFRLALLLGILQIFYGMFIKFFDNLRRKEYGVAFYDTLSWIVLVGSLVIMLLASPMSVSMKLVESPLFFPGIANILMPFVIISAIVIVLFGARNEENWGFRLFMGFLNLTIVNGITAYLGDSLSYIRLMALGLVTAGIGVAINKIAFQTLSIPVAGIIVMLVIMVIGHAFNMAINVLGGFVHTLRLQYVEFFQKFYEGGGRNFRPLKDEHKYVIISDQQEAK